MALGRLKVSSHIKSPEKSPIRSWNWSNFVLFFFVFLRTLSQLTEKLKNTFPSNQYKSCNRSHNVKSPSLYQYSSISFSFISFREREKKSLYIKIFEKLIRNAKKNTKHKKRRIKKLSNGRNDQTRVSTFSRNCKIVTELRDLQCKTERKTFRWILFSPFSIKKKKRVIARAKERELRKELWEN